MSDAGRVPDTRWMTNGACARRRDLPWLNDADKVTAWEELTMRSICQDCPVRRRCEDFARRADISGGFWSGLNRDPEATPLPGLGDVA